jgi:Uma2 family endonuclease
MALNPEKRYYTFEQYLMLLRNSDQRLEYDHGEIYVMAGSSANHAAISGNVYVALDQALGDDGPCRPYIADRVARMTPDITFLPDVVVTCDLNDHGEAFFLDSPRLVIEVLSHSTEGRDRTYKLLRYQAKESVQEIVFIDQYVQHIEVITRTSGGWDYHEYGYGDIFRLESLDIELAVAQVYRKLSIPKERKRLIPLEITEIPLDEKEE